MSASAWPTDLPDRIWIVGPSGSGKSTLAAKIAALQEVPPTHCDELHWKPGWVESAEAETAARIDAVADGPRWVIDGNYSRFRMPHHERIQLYVWLDIPLYVTLPRLVRRGIQRSAHQLPVCNGNYETFAMTFFSRDSLLLYVLTDGLRKHRQLGREVATRPHVRLRSSKQADRWLAGIEAARGEAGAGREVDQGTA